MNKILNAWYQVTDRFFHYYFIHYKNRYIGVEFDNKLKTWVVDFWDEESVQYHLRQYNKSLIPDNFETSFFLSMKRDTAKNIFEASEFLP